MGTTAQKLQAIANSKAAIKAAIEAKGVSDVGDVLADYATKIGEISGGGSSGDPRYEVSEQGALSKKSFAVNWFNDVTSISSNCLGYAYYNNNVTSVSFPNLTSVGYYGLSNAFYGCTSLTSVSLPSLSSTGYYGLSNAFYGCTSLTSVDLSSLTSVGNYGLQYAFRGCTSLTSVDLSSVTSISDGGLQYAFYGCTSLTSVDLSSLTTCQFVGLQGTFYGCTSLRTVYMSKFQNSGSNGFLQTFDGCTHLELVDFSQAAAVPGLSNTNVFSNTNNYYRIVVPNALYNQWIRATNWSDPSIVTHIEKAIKALTFKAGSANSTISLDAVGTPTSIDIEYSTDDGATFAPYIVGTTVTLANVGDQVLFRAGTNGNTSLATDASNYHKFTMTGSISIEDDISYLLNKNGVPATTQLPDYAFYGLFNGCAVLQNAPELPWTTMGEGCYGEMFKGCTSLTDAPTLPSTTLDDYCYKGMFYGCTGIETAPTLSATTLSTGCYNEMFKNCSSMNNISLGYKGNFSTTYFNDWVYGVAASGTMKYKGSDTTTGTSAIPVGWTVPQIHYMNYINTNNAQMNTGHIPTTTTSVTGRFRGDALGNWFVGNSGQKWRFFNAGTTGADFYIDVNGMSNRISVSGLFDRTKWYDIDAGNFYFECVPVDGGTTISKSSTAKSFTHTNPLLLGSSSSQEQFDCAGFKIYENDVLVKDYRPALDGNNVACFYEEVSGTYAYPSSGTFLAY